VLSRVVAAGDGLDREPGDEPRFACWLIGRLARMATRAGRTPISGLENPWLLPLSYGGEAIINKGPFLPTARASSRSRECCAWP